MLLARVASVFTLVAGLLVVVACFLPWAHVGSLQSEAFETTRGYLVLLLGLGIVGTSAATFGPPQVARATRWFPMPLSVPVAGLAGLELIALSVDLADLRDQAGTFIPESELAVSPAVGLWLIFVGAGLALVAGLVLMTAPMPRAVSVMPAVPPGWGYGYPGSIPPGAIPPGAPQAPRDMPPPPPPAR